MLNLKPKSWLILILAIGVISLAIGLVLARPEQLANRFNISPEMIEQLRDFLDQYIGLPNPPVI